VESTGLSLKRSPAFRVNCFATQSGGVRWSPPESAGVQPDYVGERKVLVDFCGLNRLTKKDRYPLPLIYDLLDAPGKARIYTKIDL